MKLKRTARAAALTVAVLSAGGASAYSTLGYTWAGGAYGTYVDEAGLVSSLPGIPLASTTNARFWVLTALSRWRERTAADLTFDYLGSKPAGAICGKQDGKSLVGVNECVHALDEGVITAVYVLKDTWTDPNHQSTTGVVCPPDVNNAPIGVAVKAWGTGSTVTEADVCFNSAPPTPSNLYKYAVTESGIASGRKDFVGSLTFAFGWVLGLDAAPSDTSMMSANYLQNPGHTFARYPLGDDIAGIQALYGVRAADSAGWVVRSTGAWGTPVAGPLDVHHASSGAIGRESTSSATTVAVTSQVWGGYGSYLLFAKTAYPISYLSTWSLYWWGSGYSSWRPPASAVKSTGSAVWALAWFGKLHTKSGCDSGMKNTLYTRGSEWSFDPAGPSYAYNLGVCAVHAPALTYSPSTNVFVLVWVQRDFTSQNNNDKVYAATALALGGFPLLWTSPQDLGFKTLDAPSVACAPTGTCSIVYLNPDSAYPGPVVRTFTINGSCQLVLASPSPNAYALQHPPTITYRQSDAKYTYAEVWTSVADDLANGYGSVWTGSAATVSSALGAAADTTNDAAHAASLLLGRDLTLQYLTFQQ